MVLKHRCAATASGVWPNIVYEHSLGGSRRRFSVPGGSSFPVSLQVETGRGVLTLGLLVDKKNKVEQVCVNMGQPILEPARIPVALEGDSVIEAAIDVQNQRMLMTCVSMGNPHAVFFTEDLSAIELEKIGPVIEHHELFPQRVNAHFVKVDSPQRIYDDYVGTGQRSNFSLRYRRLCLLCGCRAY